MAHSIQEFRGRYVRLNDLDIVASIALLRGIAHEFDHSSASIVGRWEHKLTIAGPGTIDLALDDIIRSEDDRTRMLRVLSELCRKAGSFGEMIPAAAVSQTAFAGAKLQDYPRRFVLELVDTLEHAIRSSGPEASST